MDGLVIDLRHALRGLARSKGYAAAAVVSLALGIGANSVVFTAVNRVFLTPFPVTRPSELVELLTVYRERTGAGVSYLNYLDYRARARSFSELIAMSSVVANLGSGVDTERVYVTLVSDNYFGGLGVALADGRGLGPDEDGPVAVMSHALARRRSVGAGDVIRLDSRDFTVVGIAPEGFGGLSVGLSTDVWMPMLLDARDGSVPPSLGRSNESRATTGIEVVGYLRPAVPLEQARAEVGVIARQLEEAYPDANRDRGATVERFSALRGFPNASLGAGLIAAMTGTVLLIGCANVANFMLARSWSRRHETSVRLALGSSRARLAQQVLSESLLLSLLAALVGLPMLRLGPYFVELARPPVPVPIGLDLSPDVKVLAFVFGLAMVASVLAGLAPVLRLDSADPASRLRGERYSSTEPRRAFTLRFTLLAGQIALGLVGAIVSTLFARSLSAQLSEELGFEPEGVVVASLDLPEDRYDAETGSAFTRRLTERLDALPGVDSASIATHIPLWDDFNLGFGRIYAEGRTPDDVARLPTTAKAFVGPGYFETLQLPLRRGRGISESDGRAGEPVAVVSESVAKALFPNEDPLGKRVFFRGVQLVAFHASRSEERSYRIIGVAADAKHISVGQRRMNIIYVPLSQEFLPTLSVLVRASAKGRVNGIRIAREIEAIDPELPIFDSRELPDIVLQSLFFLRAGAALLKFFGWLAAFLAAMGVYSVVAYFAAHRVREVGIRRALGASSRDIASFVLREARTYAAVGMAAGFAGASLSGRALTTLLAGVSSTDPWSYAIAGLAILAIVTAAALPPTWRAARLEPAAALRYE